MTAPTAFSVHASASGGALWWPITDPRVETLWLPLIGPTPWALLRLIDRELGDQTTWGDPIHFQAFEVAEALGVGPKRAVDALYRLRRFHLIEEDDIETTYDLPTFICTRSVPPLGQLDWTRLPASVRERFAKIPL